MPERHGEDAFEGARVAPVMLFPGISAQGARRWLGIGWVVVIGAFIVSHLVEPTGYVAGRVLWIVVALAVVRGAWVAFRLSPMPAERRFWGLLFVATAAAAASQGLDTLSIIIEGPIGGFLGSLAPVFDGATVALLVTVLLTLTRFRKATWAARARFSVDIFAACVVMVGIIDDLITAPMFAASGVGTVPAILYSIYPVIGAVVLVGTLGVVIGTRFRAWETWELRVGIAAGAFALALLLSPVGYSQVVVTAARGWGSVVIDGILLSSLYFALSAAVHRLSSHDRPWRLRPLATVEPSYGWIAAVVLPSIEVLAIPAFGIAAFQTADPTVRAFRIAVVGVIALILAARTLLAIADSEALLARADADPLTGLLNHRLFYDHLGAEVDRAARHGERVGLVALDIDDFGAVNSVGGHLAGDAALVGIARSIETAVRSQDIVCRVGGDELMVILPGADIDAAFVTAQRVLDGVHTVIDSVGRPLSASAGVAAYPEHACDRDRLVAAADAALYWAKRHGKDRAVLFDAEVVTPVSPERRIRDLRDHANLEAVRALAAAVDARDPGTQDHSRNVSMLSAALARELDLDEETATLIGHAGLLHDIGKIGVPDSVLRKPGTLTEEERARLREHATLGARILTSTAMSEIPPWVRHHHERWDGTGYPDGLAGEAIPLGARIIAVVEAYDSLASGRFGRQPLTSRAALQQIDLELGAKFDPVVGERFIRLMTAQRSHGADEGEVL